MAMPPESRHNPFAHAVDASRSARSPSLHSLIERAALLRQLDTRLRRQLSEPWATWFCVANVRSNALVLVTGQSAVAARLRMEQSRLLALAAALWPEPLTQLVVKTVPEFSVPSETPAKPLSPAAAKHLSAAAAVTDDPELRELLSRLASLAE
jgi:hypothetical protein